MSEEKDLHKEVADKLREKALEEEELQAEVSRRLDVKRGKANTYVDPVIGGNARTRPRVKDGSELGKKMYERIKHRLQGGIK